MNNLKKYSLNRWDIGKNHAQSNEIWIPTLYEIGAAKAWKN